MNITFLMLLITTFIFLALSIPLIFNKIKPNHYYGVRLPITFENDDYWYHVNRIFGISMLVANVIFVVVGFSFGLWKEGHDNESMIFAVFLLQLIIPVGSVIFFHYKNKERALRISTINKILAKFLFFKNYSIIKSDIIKPICKFDLSKLIKLNHFLNNPIYQLIIHIV